jgi:hypothetical protein
VTRQEDGAEGIHGVIVVGNKYLALGEFPFSRSEWCVIMELILYCQDPIRNRMLVSLSGGESELGNLKP